MIKKKAFVSKEPIPFYRNKVYIALITILLFVVGGYFTINGAIGLGRTRLSARTTYILLP